MAISQKDYQLTATEASGGQAGLDAYKKRIAGLRGPAPTPAPAATQAPTTSANNEFIKSLQDALFGQSGIASSETGQMDASINEAIQALQEGQAKASAGIEAFYDRQRGYVGEEGAAAVSGVQEVERGYATSLSVLKRIFEDTDKSIKDLDLREQEALAAGQVETAGKIADLKMKQMQLRVDAQQRTFQNLLASAGFALQLKQAETQEAQFNKTFALEQSAQGLQEQKAMADIALKYGVELFAGDTIDTIVARAKPFASQLQALELESVKADIESSRAAAAASRASTAKAVAGTGAVDIDAVAAAYRITGGAVLSQLTNTNDIAAVINKANELEAVDVRSALEKDKASNVSKNTAISDISSNPSITNKAQALAILEAVYATENAPKSSKTKPIFSFNMPKPGKTANFRVAPTQEQLDAAARAKAERDARNREIFGREIF